MKSIRYGIMKKNPRTSNKTCEIDVTKDTCIIRIKHSVNLYFPLPPLLFITQSPAN